MLPRFSFEQTVISDTARHDRIVAKMELGSVMGTAEEIDSMRLDLGNPSPSSTTYRERIFTTQDGRGAYRPPLEVRKKAIRRSGLSWPPPLFGGNLNLSPYGGGGQRASRLTMNLDANLTRLARFQIAGRDPERERFELFGGTAPPCLDGEFSLDGKNNWILAGSQDVWFTPDRWIAHMAESVSEIRNAMIMELVDARSAVAPQLRLEELRSSMLESCETYWEFQSENPIGHVRQMERLLSDFGVNSRATTSPPSRNVRREFRENCLVLSIDLRRGILLRVYAKTNRRIRFEVAHDLKQNAAPLERHSPSSQGTTSSRYAGNDTELLALLNMLKTNSAQIVNRAFAHMRNRNSVIPSHFSESMLLLKIGRIAKNDEFALTVSENLRVRGGVSPNGLVAGLRKAIDRMTSKGILRYNAESSLYEPTPDFSTALRSLRNRPDSLLEARHRVPAMPASSAEAPPVQAPQRAISAPPPDARVRLLPPPQTPPAPYRSPYPVPPDARLRTLPPVQ